MLRDFRLVWWDLGGMIPESPESLRKLCALFIGKIMHHVYRYFFKASCGSQPKRKICNDKCNTVVVCFTFSYSPFQLAPNCLLFFTMLSCLKEGIREHQREALQQVQLPFPRTGDVGQTNFMKFHSANIIQLVSRCLYSCKHRNVFDQNTGSSRWGIDRNCDFVFCEAEISFLLLLQLQFAYTNQVCLSVITTVQQPLQHNWRN